MSRVLLEVIVQTLDDAREAVRGGADRLEVVREISKGGLTPALSLVQSIADETALPLRVMIRGNAGFETSAAELPSLRRAAAEFAELNVDGLVIGFCRDGQPGIHDVRNVLVDAAGVPVTFHRAFDALPDPLSAIDALCAVAQIDRLLTSGGDGPPDVRCARLKSYAGVAGPRLEVIAGGGVTDEVFSWFVRLGCVREIHVGRAARNGHDQDAPVSAARVRRLRDIADAGSSKSA